MADAGGTVDHHPYREIIVSRREGLDVTLREPPLLNVLIGSSVTGVTAMTAWFYGDG
jgi:hypothetical protein